MKYISVFIFIGLLTWTWNVIHGTQTVSFETHAGIQEKVAQLIYKTVVARKPEAQNIIIEKVWTEIQANEKVLAHFIYSFVEKSAEGKEIKSQISGNGLLEKQADDGSGLDHWRLVKLQTTNDAIQFDEELVVTPGDNNNEAVPQTQEPAATQAPESH